MAKAGRPPKFAEKVNKATGVTLQQNNWMNELAEQIGVSKMALYRTSVSLLMGRVGEGISDALRDEKKDVLARIKKL